MIDITRFPEDWLKRNVCEVEILNESEKKCASCVSFEMCDMGMNTGGFESVPYYYDSFEQAEKRRAGQLPPNTPPEFVGILMRPCRFNTAALKRSFWDDPRTQVEREEDDFTTPKPRLPKRKGA